VGDIDEKNIMIQLTPEETIVLMSAVMGYLMRLKYTPSRAVEVDINILAHISEKVQRAITAQKEGESHGYHQ
jgi:hypothetical protein